MGRIGVWLLVVAACGSHGSDKAPPERAPRDGGIAVVPPVPPPPPFEVAAPGDKVVGVGRGYRHACVVRASGAVDCWGEGRSCDRCEFPRPANPSVRRIPGITDAIAISTDGSCFVRKTGEAACLDGNFEVQPVPGIKNAVGLDTSGLCYLSATGDVTCLEDRKPWTVPNVHDAVALKSAAYLTCAVRKSGAVACGSATTPEPFHPVLGLAKVTSLAISGDFSVFGCAISDRHLQCFGLDVASGANAPMKLDASDAYSALEVIEPETFDGATQLTLLTDKKTNQVELEAVVGGKVLTTDFHDRVVLPSLDDAAIHIPGCAIRAQGSLVCWGSNRSGVLAQPTTIEQEDVPAAIVPGLGDVVDLALGARESYALTRDGRIWRWGSAQANGRSLPALMPLGLGPDHLVQITADRHDHVCMRSATGDVWCQVGETNAHLEQLDTTGIRDIQSADDNLYAFRSDGAFETHSVNRRYHLDPTLAVSRSTGTDIVEIADREQLCARHKSGAVDCALPHDEIKTATALAAGLQHACAVQRGRVWCWLAPWDANGIRHTTAPFEIPGLRDVTDLASSREDVCAVHDHGRVSCWRFDDEATKPSELEVVIPSDAVDVELGTGSRGQLRSSHDLDGPIAAGPFGCAIMVDRTVKCWGMNLFGEVGDGSLIEASSPIGVKL